MNLTKVVSFLILLLAFTFTNAQDTIVLKSWRELGARELKKGAAETEFKTTIFKKERVVVISNKRIFAIKYPSATIIDSKGNSMSPTAFEYQKLTEINSRKLRMGIATTVVTSTVAAAGLGLIGMGAVFVNSEIGEQSLLGVISLAIGCFATVHAIPLTAIGALQIRKAKKGLHKAEELKASMSFNPVLAPDINSAGHAMNFRTGMGMRLNF